MGILMETAKVNLVTASYRASGAEAAELYVAMGAPGEAFYTDTLHTIAINTRETEFGSIVEPVPITLKAYKPFHPHGHPINGYGLPQSVISSAPPARPAETDKPFAARSNPSPAKEESKDRDVARPPPKKKWIKEYLGECSITTVVNTIVPGDLNILNRNLYTYNRRYVR